MGQKLNQRQAWTNIFVFGGPGHQPFDFGLNLFLSAFFSPFLPIVHALPCSDDNINYEGHPVPERLT